MPSSSKRSLSFRSSPPKPCAIYKAKWIVSSMSAIALSVVTLSLSANQGNLHFIHHTSETDILLCINNVSSLVSPTKQPPTANKHYHKLLNIDLYS